MHIHVPKPIHGWKQFFNEVAVIVIGIAIALTGEELLSHWNDERNASKALVAIKDEVAINVGHMQARMKTADCIDRRLAQIAAYIEESGTPERPQWVGRPQVWAMQTSAVDAARSYGSLTAMPVDEQMTISGLYGSIDQFGEMEHDEQWAWAELRSITEDRDLSDSDKAGLRHALQRARYAAWLLRTIADQTIAQARDLGVTPASDGDGGSHGVCVPMSTPYDQALKLASKAGHAEPR